MEDPTESSDLWRLTPEYSPVGMALVDLEREAPARESGRSRRCSAATSRCSPGATSRRSRIPMTWTPILQQLHRALDGEIDSYRLRKRYLHAEGHEVWGDLSVAVVRGPEREPLYFISQILDVSEQHEFEQRLQEAKAEIEHERNALEAIFETVSVGLLLIDAEGRYERMNRQHEETMRLPFPRRPRRPGRPARPRLPPRRQDADEARGDAVVPGGAGRGVRRLRLLGRLGPADPRCLLHLRPPGARGRTASGWAPRSPTRRSPS